MPSGIKDLKLESLSGYYHDPGYKLHWPTVFSLPFWMQAWWDAFGSEDEPLLLSVWQDKELTGIAPLVRREDEARFLGSPEVFDYLDFITVPGREEIFFAALLARLKERGINRLTLNAQRPDAAVFRALFAGKMPAGCSASYGREGVTYELELASTWDDYLGGLKKKQRHEVRRKLRRLQDEGGDYRFRTLEGPEAVAGFLPDFFDLFRQNPEKAGFMTENMEQYFRSLVTAGAREGMARFGLLEIEGTVAAAVLYFDYRGRVYLYNSGYDSAYADLSAGLLSKALCIGHSIGEGRQVFDFLKGREVYKSRLGGTAVPVFKVRIEIS